MAKLIKCSDCGNEISKKAKQCPQCGAPNKKKGIGLGGFLLFILVMSFVIGIVISSLPDGGSSGSSNYRPGGPIEIASTDVNKPWSGDKWPFTVASGKVRCVKDAAIFVSGGRTYALNGFAATQGYADIDPIWLDNEDLPGTKINISPVLNRALRLCD